MVKFKFLSTYGLFDLYMHFQKKSDANGHPKANSEYRHFCKNKFCLHFGHFGFIQNASRLVCPSFGDVGKLQKLRNFDMQAADIRKTFDSAQI